MAARTPGARTAGLETHPDLREMRARYDVAAERTVAQIVNGLIMLTGLYLAISPWVVGFRGRTDLAVNNLITGIALTILGAGLAAAFARTHGLTWVVPVIGIWTIIAPWVIYGSAVTRSMIWNNVVTGVVTVLFGAAAMAAMALRRK
ncbi:SPW repeat-containing protein [Thermomonospora echinospora]|uniref:SPW repeat-containing protein n=1 Tax=Thermomonospora echinospora TaxID=1992 RepID=A0A1H6E3E6_9ACTN|nr:SPW repeat protein [Thermomonospora echinospora]SEG92087.1 SPW repeat-containing protein [Thermomonospora echinospora]